MADDNPDLTTINAIKERTAAQAELVKAQAALLKEETAYAQARIGSVAGSSFTGAVEMAQGSGAVEASVLAAKMIADAAARIACRLPKLAPSRRYILFAGTQRPDFSEWSLFQLRRSSVIQGYEHAERLRMIAETGSATKPGARPPAALQSTTEAAALTVVGAAVDAASKLGSYFQSDYKIAPTQVSGIDADLVALSLLGVLDNAWYPARWAPPTPANLAEALLQEAVRRRDAAAVTRRGIDDAARQAAAELGSAPDPGRKTQVEAVAKRLAEAAAAFEQADKALDTLIEGLSAEASGAPRIARIAEQKAIAEALAQGDIAVVVQLATAAGSVYTRKNLWTFFGSMPFYISAGAVVSFLAIGGDGAVRAAGQIPLHSGFHKIGKVPRWIVG